MDMTEKDMKITSETVGPLLCLIVQEFSHLFPKTQPVLFLLPCGRCSKHIANYLVDKLTYFFKKISKLSKKHFYTH